MKDGLPKKKNNFELDMFDLAILRILQNDNKMSQRVIGKEVNLSVASVQRRIRRMEEAGIIAANVAVLDPDRVDLFLTIIVEIELAYETVEGIDRIKNMFLSAPQIQQCYYVSGQVDFILIIVVGDMREYEELTRRLFLTNEIVRKFRTFVVMDRVKTKMQVHF